MKKGLITLLSVFLASCIYAQDIQLNDPVKTGGKPLFDAMNDRQSNRNFEKKDMPLQTLSNLLWSANGFNREDKRVVPTSQNRQEMDVYLISDKGVYLYDAKANMLKQIQKGDFRQALGQPNISDNASFTLVYVADMSKASNREAGFIDSGFIAQNVYLFCASEGLGAVVRASFKKPDLHSALKLSNNQEITIVQAIGYIK